MSVADVSAASDVTLRVNAGDRAPDRGGRKAQWLQRGLLAVGVVGLVLLVRSLPHADWALLLRRVGPVMPLLMAIAISWMVFYARGLREILTGSVGWGRLVFNRLIGEAYNVVMPLGDLGGDPLRVLDLGEQVGTANAVRAIVFDRLVYVTGGFVFSAVASAVAVRAYVWDQRFEALLTGYAVVALVAAALLFLLTTRPRTARVIDRLLRLVKIRAPELPSALPVGVFGRALCWNLVARSLVLVEIAVVLWALGQHVRVEAVVAITAIVSVAGIIFTFIPNGVGVNEGAAVLALSLTGYGEAMGLALGLARRVRQILVAGGGVALHALWKPRRRSLTSAADRHEAKR
jgi:hypothetical protein